MKLLDVLRLLINQRPDPWAADDERLWEAEQRVNALDAMIGAQQAQRTKDRDMREKQKEGQRANR